MTDPENPDMANQGRRIKLLRDELTDGDRWMMLRWIAIHEPAVFDLALHEIRDSLHDREDQIIAEDAGWYDEPDDGGQ